jgi:hypothetical protein
MTQTCKCERNASGGIASLCADHMLFEAKRCAAQERLIGQLQDLLSAYVADETRFNRGEGEPYGSITTETGMRARAAIAK